MNSRRLTESPRRRSPSHDPYQTSADLESFLCRLSGTVRRRDMAAPIHARPEPRGSASCKGMRPGPDFPDSRTRRIVHDTHHWARRG
jgi:hypothetical protein